jgi:hypothetical protein
MDFSEILYVAERSKAQLPLDDSKKLSKKLTLPS